MSLLDKLKTSLNNGTINKKTEKSKNWFIDQVKSMKGRARHKFTRTNASKFYKESDIKVSGNTIGSTIKPGSLLAYWYSPKHAKTLPYYDIFPLIILLGAEGDFFHGLNFHYLHPKLRANFLDTMIKYGEDLNWKKIAKIPAVQPTIKQYRFDHLASKVIPIDESEYELTVFLPLEKFAKSTNTQVWLDSTKKMRKK